MSALRDCAQRCRPRAPLRAASPYDRLSAMNPQRLQAGKGRERPLIQKIGAPATWHWIPCSTARCSIDGATALFPGRFGVQVPRQLHGVVQYPADHE